MTQMQFLAKHATTTPDVPKREYIDFLMELARSTGVRVAHHNSMESAYNCWLRGQRRRKATPPRRAPSKSLPVADRSLKCRIHKLLDELLDKAAKWDQLQAIARGK